MRKGLAQWVRQSNNLRYRQLLVSSVQLEQEAVQSRAADYYLSLVGELFDAMRESTPDYLGWPQIGNALAQFAGRPREELKSMGIPVKDILLFAATAFYCGGYPASAHLVLRGWRLEELTLVEQTCVNLLRRQAGSRNTVTGALRDSLVAGDKEAVDRVCAHASAIAQNTLNAGPAHWAPAYLMQKLTERFKYSNIRAVLPDGYSEFWNDLVQSFLNRFPETWEFFPSQINAIEAGLLGEGTFSVQMPTGAGKTALCDVLLYHHLKRSFADAAILLVPYRSLASELRGTTVRMLNDLGINSKCVYGGTVPTADERHGADQTRALVATPEALSGLLGAERALLDRISLVICDEGHLLDAPSRGVGLELLLARLKARQEGGPRFVFISAIIPNIEEINVWLGGSDATVVRSEYRATSVEFALLKEKDKIGDVHNLVIQPQDTQDKFVIEGILNPADFQGQNPGSGRHVAYSYVGVKTRAVAVARKALSLGCVAVFAANKRGHQGAIGVAEELAKQLQHKLPLPLPRNYWRPHAQMALNYLKDEFGNDWIGTRTLDNGAVLHHGDIPQETREVLEGLIRAQHVRFIICTSTLAEGVNLPIRTLVLYSVIRREKNGAAINMLGRDIKNLVGRSGRPDATTKGLVVCANPKQWKLVNRVARNQPHEKVRGALLTLLDTLLTRLAASPLTDAILERETDLHSLIDGIDATLIDLVAEEIGEEELFRLGDELAAHTFAASQADERGKALLNRVFRLRAKKIFELQSSSKLPWVRASGARVRLLESVENELIPAFDRWQDNLEPTEPAFVRILLEWAESQPSMQRAIRLAYELDDEEDTESIREQLLRLVTNWLEGNRFVTMASECALNMDKLLHLITRLLSFELQTLIEQAIALTAIILESDGSFLSPSLARFPDHLRYGVSSQPGVILCAGGVRHRAAAERLGDWMNRSQLESDEKSRVFGWAQNTLVTQKDEWIDVLGQLVYDNTRQDVARVTGDDPEDDIPF